MKEKYKWILVFTIVIIMLDQVVKIHLSNNMILNQSNIIIRDFASITLVHNTGAAFSLFSGNKYLLISIGVVAILLLILYVKAQDLMSDVDIFIYGLLFGGILGNLIDRIVHGYVIDFISLNFGSYSFPVFNIADICIVLAIVVMLFRSIGESAWK